MAISHVCMSCGLDLARVRAVREPHYGLPVVVCPDCGRAAVRREPRVRRSLRRLLQALFVLAGQLGMLAIFTVTMIALGNTAADPALGGAAPRELAAWLAACTVFAIATGVWLTVGFGHFRRISVWVVFSCLALAAATVGVLDDGRTDMLPARWLAAATIMTLAVTGVPAGVLVSAAWRAVARASCRRHRRWLAAGRGRP